MGMPVPPREIDKGRLPPGQVLTEKFPVLHYGSIPRFEPSTWNFRVFGEVKEEILLTWDEFSSLPRTKVNLDIHCVTRWSKFNMVWEGVSLKTFYDLGIISPKPGARFLMQHAEHGYTANLPLDLTLQENFLLATHLDGHPITPDHGFPLRGVIGAIPGRDDLKTVYLWKGAKWLRGLELMDRDRPGFWEQAGYNNEADVWNEERFG